MGFKLESGGLSSHFCFLLPDSCLFWSNKTTWQAGTWGNEDASEIVDSLNIPEVESSLVLLLFFSPSSMLAKMVCYRILDFQLLKILLILLTHW